jgi:hypothetical protein
MSLALALLAASLPGGIDPALAQRCFQEVRWASEDDGGKLWGKPLYGPTLFFDPVSGDVVANQADKEGKLHAQSGVFAGSVPHDFAGANTALDWAGVHWTVVLWPLPDTSFQRARLVLHESWHRIQDELGLPSVRVGNEHLATKDGRIWLLMEYRALAKALPAWGPERKRALEDALAFRAYRRSLFPKAAAEEDRMEVHEGLAEYTGFAAAGLDNHEARYYMAGRLKLAALKPALSYAFAYETGPAYGLMLDMGAPDWRHELKPDSSLSGLLAARNKIEPAKPALEDVLKRSADYDGATLIAAETKRDEEQKAAEAGYRHDLVSGPVLQLRLVQKNFTFDPNAVVPLAGEGTVYLGAKFIDEWGILTAEGAALASANLSSVRVPAPASATALEGLGWKLELNPGWKVVAGPRPGDFSVAKP